MNESERITRLERLIERLKVLENGAATGGGHTIQDEGVDLAARTHLNFIGAGVTATDNAGTDATDITIPGGGGSVPPWIKIYANTNFI